MLLSKLNNWLQSSVRIIFTVFVCGMLFIATANPVQAATSSATEGEASLNRVQAKTDDVARSNPRGINEVTKEAQKGLNAVQGSADADKMIDREDANATTIEEKAASFLDKLTN